MSARQDPCYNQWSDLLGGYDRKIARFDLCTGGIAALDSERVGQRLYLRGQRGLAGNGALSLCLQALERIYTGHTQLYLLLHSRNVAVELLNTAVCLVERILHAAQRNVRVFRTQADLIGCILHLTAGVIDRFLLIFLCVVLVASRFLYEASAAARLRCRMEIWLSSVLRRPAFSSLLASRLFSVFCSSLICFW